jgi:hypothetical protein
MVASKFLTILQKKEHIQQVETTELKAIVKEYPYFQAARSLYLKGLKNNDSFKYNTELKITASHTTDRTILFKYITSTNFNTQKQNIHQQISDKLSETTDIEAPVETSKNPSEKNTEIKKELGIGKPISFTSVEHHSFNEWLQISTKKPIVREVTNQTKKPIKKEELIDTFIKNNPKIAPLSKDHKSSVAIKKNKQDSSLMTETLARVYLEQEKFENAIQAYRILSLKYPEKSGFFADQIKRIQILQKK